MKILLYPPLSINELGQRNNREDSVVQWNNRLFVLCDGMGGHEKGEVASQTVCQSLATWFEQNINSDEPFTDDQLREALEYAYQQLDQYANGNPKQMGTTLTLLYIHQQGMTAAHIGDSRIYHIRPNVGVLYQSRDHSLAYDLFQSGEITYDEMLNFTQKNVITRAMTTGKDNRHRPDIIHIIDIQADDYFYMCTDGMLEHMSNEELVMLISSKKKDEEKRQQLIFATSNNQDNHSAWLIHIKDAEKTASDCEMINEEPTARCNALNIKPQASDDVKIADSNDDVVLVTSPQSHKSKRKIGFYQIIFIVLTIIFSSFCVWYFLVNNSNDKEVNQEKIIMQKPIQHRTNTHDSTMTIKKDNKDSKQNKNESKRD